MRSLDHVLIGRRLHHTQQRRITAGIGTGFTDRLNSETIAALAVLQCRRGMFKSAAQLVGAYQIVLQQVVGHAASATLAHTG
jgi:hypothetical protein